MNREDLTNTVLSVRKGFLTHLRVRGFYYRGKLRYDSSLWDINNGYCDEFNQLVLDVIDPKRQQAVSKWLHEIDTTQEEFGHNVIVFRDRYYDAETPQGVDKIQDLPFFKNEKKSRAVVNRERKKAAV